MDTVFLVLLLIVATVLANIVYWKYDSIPIAFIQIGMGLILSFLPIYRGFHLEPEIFMLVIISVLMFNDGQNTSLSRLTHQVGTTFSLSVVLAIISILVVGFITHLFIPSIPLALAFALGAIITPTDAVAVSSITNNMMVPTDVMGTLENESLFNDASGIVALNLAISAVVTGEFSVIHGIENFLYVFFGGIILGLILGSIIVSIRLRLIHMHVDTPSVMVPYTILTPFAVYLIAEAVGVSGILAVVVTGLIHGVQQNRLRLTSSRLQIVTTSTWSVIASLLNGIVFVLLGLSLPRVIMNLHNHDTGSVVILFGVGILLYIIMTALRYLWTRFDFAEIRAWDKHDKHSNSIIMALSGVHGTITLAMAFSLPLTLNGHAFTYRNDMIFVAAVVILVSLLVPTVLLPIMLPPQVAKYTEDELAQAKAAMVNDAIFLVHNQFGDSSNTSHVVNILDGQRTVRGEVNRAKLTEIFDDCFEIEKQTVFEMLNRGEISADNYDLYMRVAKRTVIQYQQSFWQRLILFLRFNVIERFSLAKKARRRRKLYRKMKKHNHLDREQMLKKNRQMWSQMKDVEKLPYEKITGYLNEILTVENGREVSIVRFSYDERHRRLVGREQYDDSQNELLIHAFQQEYNFVQAKIISKEYSRELGAALYEQISTDQLVYLQSISED